jgi:hypothetical protein
MNQARQSSLNRPSVNPGAESAATRSGRRAGDTPSPSAQATNRWPDRAHRRHPSGRRIVGFRPSAPPRWLIPGLGPAVFTPNPVPRWLQLSRGSAHVAAANSPAIRLLTRAPECRSD